MRETVRPLLVALSVACLSVSLTALSNSAALAQAKQAPANQMAPAQPAPPQVKQMALTEKQIESALAATKEMDPITAKIPQDAKPDPKITATARSDRQEGRLCQLRRL